MSDDMRDKVLQSVLDSQRQRLRTREFFLKNACEVHGVPYDGGERVDVKEDQPPPAQDASCSAPNRPSVPQAKWRQATRWVAGLAAASALGSGGYFAGNYGGDKIMPVVQPVVQPVEQPVEQQHKDLLQALESHGDHLHPEISHDD